MKFLVVLFFVLFVDLVMAQQTVDKIKVNNLNLPSESASSALLINGSKQVKASASVSSTELEYLDGVSSAIQTQLNGKQATLAFTPEDVANKSTSTSLGASDTLYPSQNAVKSYVDSNTILLSGNQSAAGTKTFTGRIAASTTTNAFIPCPVMNNTQRGALSPVAGDCIYNTTNSAAEFYNGSAWGSATVSTATVTAPGVTNPKTCYYAFGGASATLAAPTNCTTGTCVEVYDSCSSVTPPTRSSAGIYIDTTFSAGVWANSTPLKCDCEYFNTSSGTSGECIRYFVTPDQTWSTSSGGGAVINMISYDNNGTLGDGYIFLSCTAAAP